MLRAAKHGAASTSPAPHDEHWRHCVGDVDDAAAVMYSPTAHETGGNVGNRVGDAVGAADVGKLVGAAVGATVGTSVGTRVGAADGAREGDAVGATVGAVDDGMAVGTAEGAAVGNSVGTRVGAAEGARDGEAVGALAAHIVGSSSAPKTMKQSTEPSHTNSPGMICPDPPPQSKRGAVGAAVGAGVGHAAKLVEDVTQKRKQAFRYERPVASQTTLFTLASQIGHADSSS